MATIALHRLTDWPSFRHVRPLLAVLGIDDPALEHWHYYYRKGSFEGRPFRHISETGGIVAHEEALFAASKACAVLAPQLVNAHAKELVLGFHWSASQRQLVEAAENAGHQVVLVADRIANAPPTAEHLLPFYAKWERTALRAMLKEALEPASAKLAQRYIDDGGTLPPLTRRAGAARAMLELSCGFVDWTARHERMLDVFVAVTEQRACPRWSSSGDRGQPHDDSAGRLRDALVSRNVSDGVLLSALCKEKESGQVAFGHEHWPSRHALLAGWFARLDAVANMGAEHVAALFQAQAGFPDGLRELAGLVTERWCRLGGFARLDVTGLAACARLNRHSGAEAFLAEANREYTTRVLDLPNPALRELVAVSFRGGPRPGAEQHRFEQALQAAAARHDGTLLEWQTAKTRGLVTDDVFAAGILPAFRRALAAEFRTGADGFGDQEGFMATAAIVGAVDPDLCLRGLTALSERFNEYGLKAHVDSWDGVVPKRGFSREVMAEVAAHFSSPARRSAAKILAKLLATRGIEIRSPEPPALETVDEELHVGTDVAHLLVGSYEAVEAVADEEDPDDWPTAIKKHKCVGLVTGADGSFTVRILGVALDADVAALAKRKAKGAAHVATFPLQIKKDALTVSGIVGAGGTPTIPFPSGVHAAEVFADGRGIVTIFVQKVKKAPKWTFENQLPHL